MGVDYFPCDRCSHAICDCGDWVDCNEECGRRWCYDECAEADGRREAEDENGDTSVTCKYCRNEDVDDCELLKFLLKHCKLTRKRAVKMLLDKSKRRKVKP